MYFIPVRTKKDGRDYPFPLSSFAIQIKSNKRPFDFSPNIAYLSNLEIPFLVGVLDESLKRLSFYSGENLPVFFPHIGSLDKLTLKPLERNKMTQPYNPDRAFQGHYTVMFPRILDIDMDSTRDVINTNVDELQKICSLIHRNISARKTQEFIFESYNEESVTILAGPGSANTYRNNFMKRLAENFSNLKWILENHSDKKTKIIEEFNIYEVTYKKILNLYGNVPSYLASSYEQLKKILSDSSVT